MKKTMRQYNDEIQPLRVIKFDENATAEERADANEQLQRLTEEYYTDYPVITGTFCYTQADVEVAKKAGF